MHGTHNVKFYGFLKTHIRTCGSKLMFVQACSEVPLWTGFGTGKTEPTQRNGLSDEKISYMFFFHVTQYASHLAWRGVLNIHHCFIYYVFTYTNFKLSLFFFFYRLSILKIPLRFFYKNIFGVFGNNNEEEFSYQFCGVRVIAGVEAEGSLGT